MASAPLVSAADLEVPFSTAQKSPSHFRVGLEAEKFGFELPDNTPLPYEGSRGASSIFAWAERELGWKGVREYDAGPIVAVQQGDIAWTLEPGAQFELSGSPVDDLHQVVAEYRGHLAHLQRIGETFDVWFAQLGFHPFASTNDLPWVPKRRYPIMKRYLPTKGSRALDMMQRTATVQVNLDYSSEADAMFKLVTLLKITPLIQAMTLNAPLIEGRQSRLKSERLDVWLNMDASRSGLIPQLWTLAEPRYADYVQWALQAGMFLFVRDGHLIENTGQSFADFLEHGFEQQRATEADWRLHLGTLFPEVRLKSTLEVRCCDAVPPALTPAIPALLTGITYDEKALSAAREIGERLNPEQAIDLQRSIAVDGLKATFDGQPVQATCLRLLELASDGLRRRQRLDASGNDESRYLQPLETLIRKGLTPADQLLAEVSATGDVAQTLRRFQAESPAP